MASATNCAAAMTIAFAGCGAEFRRCTGARRADVFASAVVRPVALKRRGARAAYGELRVTHYA